MNSIIFVDVQGFKDDYNRFIIKEFALCTEEFTQVFLIKPPYVYTKLTREEKKRVKWIERNRGIYWNEGNIDYREFQRLIIPILKNKTIIMKGLEKQKWIKELCNDVYLIDIEERGSPSFSLLYKIFCKFATSYNCLSHKNECALKNAICVKQWYMNNSE